MNENAGESQENANIKNLVYKYVDEKVDKKIKHYRKLGLVFLAGAFLLIGIGLIPRVALFKVAIQNIYPPGEIYKDVKDKILGDSDFKKQMFGKDNFTEAVWSTMQTGSKVDYSKMISRDEFSEPLYGYYGDLVKSIILPNVGRRERAEDILELGKIPQDVQILMVNKGLDNEPTANCYKIFLHTQFHAILVIPEAASETEYAWFNCIFGWPKIYLKLKAHGNELTDIQLVGVRRNGKTNKLIVLVSREVSRRLDLPGWESYDGNAFGVLTVSSVK